MARKKIARSKITKEDLSFNKISGKGNTKKLKSKMYSQSAMEYLMTYGWAILIIAIVLVSLYEIGAFNVFFSHHVRGRARI